MRDTGFLSLGTANWGQSYGVLSGGISPGPEGISAIINFARDEGIRHLDTAIDYASAELILGNVGVPDFVITTKLPGVPSEVDDVQSWFRQQIEGSLNRLRVAKLGCVLLHRPEELTTNRGDLLAEALLELKRSGLVAKVGVSIYEPEILDSLSNSGILARLDVVQAPMNALDRRLVDSDWASKLMELGIEIEARSIFLQGLLTTPIAELPPSVTNFSAYFEPWWTHIRDCGESPVTAAMNAVSQLGIASRLIVGVQNLSQFREIISAMNATPSSPSPKFEGPLALIDPRGWPTTSP